MEKAENEKKPSAVSDVGAWAMNVTSSVGIIMANKQLMSSSGFGFSFGLIFLICISPIYISWICMIIFVYTMRIQLCDFCRVIGRFLNQILAMDL